MIRLPFSILILSLLILPAVSLAEPLSVTIEVSSPDFTITAVKPILSSAFQVVPGIFLVQGKNLQGMSLMLLPDQINSETIAPNWSVISQSGNFIRFKVALPTSLPAGSYQLYAYPAPMPTISNSSNEVTLKIDRSAIPARRFCANRPIGDLNLDGLSNDRDLKIVSSPNIFLPKFLTHYPCADVDNSGKITATDRATLNKCLNSGTCGLWPLSKAN